MGNGNLGLVGVQWAFTASHCLSGWCNWFRVQVAYISLRTRNFFKGIIAVASGLA